MPIKHVNERIQLSTDFTSKIEAMGSGLSIASAICSITDLSDDSDVTGTLVSSSTGQISGFNVAFTFVEEVGVNGNDYKVAVLATLDDGQIIEDAYIIQIRDNAYD